LQNHHWTFDKQNQRIAIKLSLNCVRALVTVGPTQNGVSGVFGGSALLLDGVMGEVECWRLVSGIIFNVSFTIQKNNAKSLKS
jgi:hypothetical protein